MKYELTDKEFRAIHRTFDNMIDKMAHLIKFQMENSHQLANRRLALEEAKFQHQVEKGVVGKPPKHMSYTPPPVVSFSEETVEDDERIFPEIDLSDHQRRGKIHLAEMLTVWSTNFRKEGEPQPDRNECMEELARDGTKAGAIVSYSMKLGGLTKACWNVAQELLEDGNFLDEYATPEAIRYLAGNITQVASVHLGPLADEFEYPNPLTQWSEQ